MQTINIKYLMSVYAITVFFSSPEDASPSDNPTVDSGKSRYIMLDVSGKIVSDNKAHASCVEDLQTGLVWELKTDDDGIHDKDNRYRWGGVGADATGTLFYNDWTHLVNATNAEKLCNVSHWRLPTIEELKSLLNSQRQGLKIDTDYFPLTLASPYWSVSTYAHYPEHAQTVDFGTGDSNYYNGYRGDQLPVRLVCSKTR